MVVRPQPLAVIVVGILLVASVSFAVDATGGIAKPVPFKGTNEGGLPSEATQIAEESDAVIPRAEAYFAQYPYVTGYDGIPYLINDLNEASTSREFGRVLTVYVSDFTGTGVYLDDSGTLSATNEGNVSWVTATDAYFVVNSRARTTGNTTAVVPFSDRTAARRFADRYEGTVVQWDELRQRRFEGVDWTQRKWERTVEQRQQWANRTTSQRQTLRDRPVSVVVGTDAPNLSAAIARAPPNTTVRVPAGTYDVTNLTVGKPLTIAGAGPNQTRISGDRRASVFTVGAAQTAITDLSITGIGNRSDTGRTLVSASATHYDLRQDYGRGAAGVVLNRATRSLVANVTIDTPTHGLRVRDSSGTVITDTTVYGPPQAAQTAKNSIAVSVMSSRIVVEDSKLYGGFHSFIILNTTGIVVRNIHAEGTVTGFHELYSSRGLVINSTFRDMFKSIMSAIEGSANAAVGNDVRNTAVGIDFAGSRSYVTRNTVAHNRIGILIEGRGTLYTDNVVGYNHAGIQVGNPFPTNRITRNDFVGNDQHVEAEDENVLYVWTEAGRGNYWAGFDRFDRDGDGVYERPIRPTGVIGTLSYRTPVERPSAAQWLSCSFEHSRHSSRDSGAAGLSIRLHLRNHSPHDR